MNIWLWGSLAYALMGFVSGLYAANEYYSDDDRDKATHATVAFFVTFFIWPIAALIFFGYWLGRGCAWLLPAYRAEQRKVRAKAKQTRLAEQLSEAEKLRAQVDDLHQTLGIAKVDWTGQL